MENRDGLTGCGQILLLLRGNLIQCFFQLAAQGFHIDFPRVESSNLQFRAAASALQRLVQMLHPFQQRHAFFHLSGIPLHLSVQGGNGILKKADPFRPIGQIVDR